MRGAAVSVRACVRACAGSPPPRTRTAPNRAPPPCWPAPGSALPASQAGWAPGSSPAPAFRTARTVSRGPCTAAPERFAASYCSTWAHAHARRTAPRGRQHRPWEAARWGCATRERAAPERDTASSQRRASSQTTTKSLMVTGWRAGTRVSVRGRARRPTPRTPPPLTPPRTRLVVADHAPHHLRVHATVHHEVPQLVGAQQTVSVPVQQHERQYQARATLAAASELPVRVGGGMVRCGWGTSAAPTAHEPP